MRSWSGDSLCNKTLRPMICKARRSMMRAYAMRLPWVSVVEWSVMVVRILIPFEGLAGGSAEWTISQEIEGMRPPTGGCRIHIARRRDVSGGRRGVFPLTCGGGVCESFKPTRKTAPGYMCENPLCRNRSNTVLAGICEGLIVTRKASPHDANKPPRVMPSFTAIRCAEYLPFHLHR
jgi:hypothetical protein